MGHTVVVTHTDLDGVASATVYLRAANLKPGEATIIYAEPYNLDEKLGEIADHLERGDRLAIMDLGVNRFSLKRVAEMLKSLTSRGVEVEWYDHHVWNKNEVETIKALGVSLFVDKSTCAAGVVAKYATEIHASSLDGVVEDLVRATCAADLWLWNHPLAPKLFRVAGRRSEEAWKNRLIEKFYKGILWDEEMEERLQAYINRELEAYDRVLGTLSRAKAGKCTIVATYKPEGPPSTSIVGTLILSRYGADVAVIVKSSGAMSLRSRRVDVSRIAMKLGGGGHAAAAGAKPRIPVYIKILSFLTPRALSWYAARLVAKTAMEVGACRAAEEHSQAYY